MSLPHVEGSGGQRGRTGGAKSPNRRAPVPELDVRRAAAMSTQPGTRSYRNRDTARSYDATPRAASSYEGSRAKRGAYTERRAVTRGPIEQHYTPQGFDLETSKRKQGRRDARQNKLPPLPCDSLNLNSPVSRTILEKLELYRQSKDKLLQLHERAETRKPSYMTTPFNTPRNMGFPGPDESQEPFDHGNYNAIMVNKMRVTRMSSTYRKEQSHAFMEAERRKLKTAAETRTRLQREAVTRKNQNSQRHEEMRLKREEEEMIIRTYEANSKLAMTIHLSTIVGHFAIYAKELTQERLKLRQANIAARVIQRKAKPWVANRRAKKEAWALEIISRAFRKYVQKRMHKKKTEATAAIYAFLKITSNASVLISTLHHFRQCTIKMQRFLRARHREITARRMVDMGMWEEWENVMMDRMRGMKKKKPKKKKNPHRKLTLIEKSNFESMGGFGRVDPKSMKPLPLQLKESLLRLFRRSRNAASLKVLAEYQADLKVWEEEWDKKADEMREQDIEAGFTPESQEERADRKKSEMPPPKQPRKLLSYADISTLHNVGLSVLQMVNMTPEEVEKYGISLQADLSAEALQRITADIDSAAEELTIFEGVPQSFQDIVLTALAERKAAKAEDEARKLQGLGPEDEEEGSDEEDA